MIDNEAVKLAEALGCKLIPLEEVVGRHNAFRMKNAGMNVEHSVWAGVFQGHKDDSALKYWLNSPEGEKVVRKKVRGLCGIKFTIEYDWYNIGKEEVHRIKIRSSVISSNRSKNFDYVSATEHEAYAAALLWLDERK